MGPLEVFWQNLNQNIRIGDTTLAFSVASVIFSFVLPVVVVILAAHFGNLWIGRILKRSKWPAERQKNFQRFVIVAIRLAVVVIIALLVSPFVENRVTKFLEDIYKVIARPIYKAGSTEISFLTIILTIPILYLANLTGRAARRAFERSKFISDDMIDSRKASIGRLIRFSIFLFFVLLWLSFIGLDLSSIEIFIAVIGGGISFGIRDLIGNFFSGVVITLNKTVREGDFLTVETSEGQITGRVSTIRLLSLILTGSSGATIIVPSGKVLLGIVKHSGHEGEFYYLPISLPLAPESDFNRVESTLNGACKSCLPESNPPTIVIDSFEPGAMMVSLTLSVKHGTDPMVTKAKLMRQLTLDLRLAGIKFAGPLGS